MTGLMPIVATPAVALGGAALAALLTVHAGALIGVLMALALAATLRLKARVPIALRDCSYLMIGVSLGAGIDSLILAQLSTAFREIKPTPRRCSSA